MYFGEMIILRPTGLYSSEPLFSGEIGKTLIFILITAVCACLPAAAAFRAEKKNLAAGCLGLGLAGAAFFIPWIVAVILVVRNVSFKKKSSVPELVNMGRIYGAMLTVLGLIFLAMGIRSYSSIMGQIYEEVLGGVISSAITTSIGICLIGGMTIACTFARDKGFWGWYMAVPVLGTYCMMVLGFYPAILRYISYIAILLGNVFIGWQVYNGVMLPDGTPAANGFTPRQTSASNRSVPRQPPVVNRSMPRQPSADVGSMPRSAPVGKVNVERQKKGMIHCLSGQYAGAQFELKDEETLGIGSDPRRSHLILTGAQIGPIHMEITYQGMKGNYRLDHSMDCPVYMKGYGALGEHVILEPGTEISVGAPAHTFRLG